LADTIREQSQSTFGGIMSTIVKALVNSYTEIACRYEIDDLLLSKIDLDLAVKALYERGELSSMERKILEVASLGHSPNSGGKELGMSRWKYRKMFNRICSKIARYLGWEYSDERFILNVQQVYNPTGEDMEKLKREMLKK